MKKLITTTLAILIFASMNFVQAQSLDDVLKKHFKAVGQDKLVAAKTYHMKAKLSQMGQELPMEIKMKRPNKFRVEMEMMGQKMIQAYDGEKGWMIAPWLSPDPQVLEGDQLKQAMEQTDFEGELYNYKQKGNTVEFVGKVNADGKEAYKIKLTAADGSVKNFFIDAGTNLILKVKAKISAQGQEIEVEQLYGDYKNFDGINMPTSLVSKTPMGNVSITMLEFKINEKFDDSIFAQPVK
jgi:outer membrane lipoprotein-sorting protein